MRSVRGSGGEPYFDQMDVEFTFGLVHDGVAELCDIESQSGDESELASLFTLDRTEARELGADLDPVDGPEPVLD